ncbi:PR domain zinc finger protein 5-like [Galleria mellonella]|uniref:PR domain zinc finger protein 5-like n=1 Tax=Galleria mellonella TaxID=7137 RepID=A0A6J1W8U1_GALME|nr:PR domain zinc finger protein 5-like [Galleria mellonella]
MDSCRCCLTKPCFKNISDEYSYGGQIEIYSDMLLNTFNLYITKFTDCEAQMICDRCITRLRDATEFKKQVLSAEETLLSQYTVSDGLSKEGDLILDIKEEDYNETSDGQSDDSTFIIDQGSINDSEGQIFVIKMDKKEESVNEKSTVRRPLPVRRKSEARVRSLRKSNTSMKTKTKKTPDISQTQIDLRENSLKLVQNSNLCLFKSRKTRFGCFFCKESFLKIAELREHNKMHSNTKILKLRFNSLRGLSYKNVEITNLACNTCSETCKDLQELKTHLQIHNIKFGVDTERHLLIPYKLEGDLKCTICAQNFNTFTRLAVHMNKHFMNNVCEICGVSYINRLSLRTHVNSMHREKKCTLCPATFLTNYSKVKHMKKSHDTGASKRYCLLCNKTFRYTYMLLEHRIQEHGAQRQIYECTECGKTFYAQQNLKTHIRCVHIKERNYPCSICFRRFFTKCDQRRHERSHEDVRSFSCGYCEGRFKSKDSLRRHLKRQHGQMYEK